MTAGLGCALAKLGHRVLVVDTDAGLRSLDLMLGVGGSTVYDMADIFAGNCEPIRAIYPSPVCPNVFVVPAPVSFEKLCTPQDMKRLCRGFARYYDHVIIDCPAGLGRGFETAVAAAERPWWSPRRIWSAPGTPRWWGICSLPGICPPG